MGTKTPRTKMPLTAWLEFCRQVAALAAEREKNPYDIAVMLRRERLMGFIDGMQACRAITLKETNLLADVAFYALTGRESQSCRP
jgi:hypothetical protein